MVICRRQRKQQSLKDRIIHSKEGTDQEPALTIMSQTRSS